MHHKIIVRTHVQTDANSTLLICQTHAEKKRKRKEAKEKTNSTKQKTLLRTLVRKLEKQFMALLLCVILTFLSPEVTARPLLSSPKSALLPPPVVGPAGAAREASWVRGGRGEGFSVEGGHPIKQKITKKASQPRKKQEKRTRRHLVR